MTCRYKYYCGYLIRSRHCSPFVNAWVHLRNFNGVCCSSFLVFFVVFCALSSLRVDVCGRFSVLCFVLCLRSVSMSVEGFLCCVLCFVFVRVDVCGRFSVLCFVLCLRSVSMSVEGSLCCVLYFVFAPCRCLWKVLVFCVVFCAFSSLRVDVCGRFSMLCFVLCRRSVSMSVEGFLCCVLYFVFAPCRCLWKVFSVLCFVLCLRSVSMSVEGFLRCVLYFVFAPCRCLWKVFCVVFCTLSSLRVDVCGRFSVLCFVLCLRSVSMSVEGSLCCVLCFVFAPCRCLWKVFYVVFCTLSSLRVDVCGRFSVLCFVLCLRSVSMSVEGFLCCILYFVFAPCRCLWKVFCVVFCTLSSLRVDVCGRFSMLCFVLCLRSVSMSVEGFLCCVLYFVFAPCRCLWKVLVFCVVFCALSSLRVDVCGRFSVLCFVLCLRSVSMSVEGFLCCVLYFVFAPCRCLWKVFCVVFCTLSSLRVDVCGRF